ncbi:hypothetical protein [Coralliovum pocilloporae]|uniref:hypothetical protein n=1 Tax=Coralliovum pocilloporae TaxID=3066369 RepID=UPI003306EBBB
MNNKQITSQEIALLILRITIGMLLVWWGLAKVVNPGMGVMVSKKFYFDMFSIKTLQYYFGYVQIVVGACVASGFLRRFAVPAQLMITGISSLAIWQALLDPFGLYLPVAKVAGIQHLFYPSAIILAASATLIVFRSMDRLALDNLFFAKRDEEAEDYTAPVAAE